MAATADLSSAPIHIMVWTGSRWEYHSDQNRWDAVATIGKLWDHGLSVRSEPHRDGE